MSAENVLDLSHAAKWTNAAGKIQLVKCIKPDGTTGGGVRPLVTWPAVGGEVTPSDPRRDGECGGGIHGWPWGLFLGDGARPDYSTDWLVIECDPQDIYCIGGKCKCVGPCTVVYRGQWWGAMEYTQHERTQLIQHVAASASASATGYGGAALATSYGGAALATGYMGAALATGEESTVGSAASGTCVLMARSGYWIVRRGAVLLQSWQDGDAHPYRVFDSIALGLEDGEKVAIVAGELRRATAAPDRSQP